MTSSLNIFAHTFWQVTRTLRASLTPCTNIQWCRNRGARRATGPIPYLADQLTLLQSGEVDYTHLLLLAPQIFSPHAMHQYLCTGTPEWGWQGWQLPHPRFWSLVNPTYSNQRGQIMPTTLQINPLPDFRTVRRLWCMYIFFHEYVCKHHIHTHLNNGHATIQYYPSGCD